MDDIERVIVRTKAGRLHRAVMTGGVPLTSESCNLDDSDGEEVVDATLLDTAEWTDLCQNPSCFGDPAA